MDNKKRELNPSSLLDLKAELLKKQQEVKKNKGGPQKLSQKANVFRKTSVWNKKNAGVLERAQKDLEEKKEEDDVLGRSRKQLEAKTRLYEAMTRVSRPDDIPAEDGSQRFLVDFEQKGVQSLSDINRQEKKPAEESGSKSVSHVSVDSPETDETDNVPEGEQWVDYVDRFGRSRRCMKKDLPREIIKKQQESADKPVSEPEKSLMSADMQRELVRQKWEEHERLTASNPDDPIHYANVQYNEIRTHGTGFYQFAKTEEEREKQLDALREIREQTKESRAKREKLQGRKKAMMKERLLKVKRRKLMREGKDPDEIEAELTSSDEDGLIGPSVKDKEPELLKREEHVATDAPTREWDVGKQEDKWFSEERWLEDRRNERVSDFAPPQMYNEESRVTNRNKGVNNTQRPWNRPQKGQGYGQTVESLQTNQERTPRDSFTAQEYSAGTEYKGRKAHETSRGNIDPMAALEQGLQTVTKATRDVPMVNDTIKDPMAALENSLLGNTVEKESGVNEVSSDVIGQGLREIRSALDGSRNTGGQGLRNTNTTGTSQNTSDLGHIPLPSSGQGSTDTTTKPQVGDPQLTDTSSGLLPNASSYDQYYAQYGHLYGYGTGAEYTGGHPYTDNSYPASSGNYTVPPPVEFPPSQDNINNTETYDNHKAVVTSYQNTSINQTSTVSGHISTTANETVSTENKLAQQEMSTKKVKAPQPAHLSAAPTKADPRRAQVKYERVNLYDIPDELPAPIASNNVPEYPSMQEMLGSRSDGKKPQPSEEKQIKNWKRQFQGQRSDAKSHVIDRVKHANLPFVSSYVQSKGEKNDGKEEVTFDPSKPPPVVDKSKQKKDK